MLMLGLLVLMCCCTVAVTFTAQKPEMKVITKNISSSCSKGFISVGDFVTFEVRLSGNNSEYTYDIFGWPTFREWYLAIEKGKPKRTDVSDICDPFHAPEEGFCVKKDIIDATYCSCENIRKDVYRLKLVYQIVTNSKVAIGLQWPSQSGIFSRFLTEFFDLPEALESCPLKTIEQPPTYPEQDASNSETSSSCDGWCVWGIISITIIVIFTIIAVFILAHYYGYVYIRFYDHYHLFPEKQKNSKNSGDQPSGNLTEEKFPTINKPSESACVRQSEDNHGVSMDE